MLIAILFFFMMLGFDYLALVRYKGTFYAFLFSMLAFATAFLLLTSTALANPTTYPKISISSTSGNTTIQAFNVTSQLAPNILHFLLPVIELLIFVHFVLILLSIGGFFIYRRKRRYGVI